MDEPVNWADVPGLVSHRQQSDAAQRGGHLANVLQESLTIAGRVAMWRPMQIYLYDWWPLRRRARIYERLSHMPVEVIQKGKS
jgi:hypothetical protein